MREVRRSEESSRSTSTCIISVKWCHSGKVTTVLNEEHLTEKCAETVVMRRRSTNHKLQAACCRLRNLLLEHRTNKKNAAITSSTLHRLWYLVSLIIRSYIVL